MRREWKQDYCAYGSIIGARLPRVGVADNQSSRTSDESLRFCIFYRRLPKTRRQEARAEVLRSQSEWRQQLARIACTEMIDGCICYYAKGTALHRDCYPIRPSPDLRV